MANIKVAVRVRPVSTRELNVTGSEVIVRTDVKEISLTNLKVSSSKAGDSRERTRKYGFDYCFDSSNPEAESYADQTTIYETLGHSVLDALFSGYNTCLVAYGQSASGKTYTMMGPKDNPGLTPRLCEGLFARIEEEGKKEKFYRVSVSYLEIYNERVRDLLKPLPSTTGLRVREHPRLGPYVQGLTHRVVDTLGSLMSYVEEGTKARKTAPTLQNPSSSRSHALLTVAITSSTDSACTGNGGHSGSSRRIESAPRGGSKLHLVDLAGSENAATCSGVHRLKEGANINKSLVALGNVISALAERGSNGNASSRRRFIPYRDSSLTWLLKDALGGNATTIMLATISPASGSYNETAHTLRFAQRAQSVVNRPVVNEDPVARIIRELRAEVARLKSLLLEKNIDSGSKSICCCKYDRDTEELEDKELRKEGEQTKQEQPTNEYNNEDSSQRIGNAPNIKRRHSCELGQIRKHPSCELPKRANSYELLVPNDCFVIHRYKRAEVAELEHEDGEVIDEIIEPAFVDIPTLVAVLIKPDNNLQIGSAQIEEICSDEDLAEGDFLDNVNDRDSEKSSTFVSPDRDQQNRLTDTVRGFKHTKVEESIKESKDIFGRDSNNAVASSERQELHDQKSIDVALPANLSNLGSLKKFGSVDGLQKRLIPSLERSHTTLDKRSIILDKVKKLNNIKEREDQRVVDSSKLGSVWRTISNASSRENLHRKGSNDSDKSSKDSYNVAGVKAKIFPRKTSLDGLKRKTSKDSSSSSSKDEQILFSNLARDKLLRRKNSLDQDVSAVRAHTPIQRPNRRAQIVAAVTQRLYTNRKQGEDAPSAAASTSSGIRSPPDLGTDGKSPNFSARMKLQDISRKMLGKRRRTCVDTQTDDQTLRVKDAATLTDEPKIVRHEIGVLTDYHESCQDATPRDDNPVLRVKEVATSTDVFRQQTKITRCKDVECFVNDLDDEDYCSRNDSGILSDDTQNYAESNFSSAETSDLCPEGDKRIVCTESSTNTVHLSSPKNMGVQTQRQEVKVAEEEQLKFLCSRPCCKPTTILENTPPNSFLSGLSPPTSDKNVISISVPDMISITIESTNLLESKISLSSNADTPEERSVPITRDSQVQTDKIADIVHSGDRTFCFKDVSMRPAIVQTDSRTFRIENIFQDSKTAREADPHDEVLADRTTTRKSCWILTNSLGTSISDVRGVVTNINVRDVNKQYSEKQNKLSNGNVIPAGLMTDTFISRRCTPPSKVSHPTIRNNTCKYLSTAHSTGLSDFTKIEQQKNNSPVDWSEVNDTTSLNELQNVLTSNRTCIDSTVNLKPGNVINCKKSRGTALPFFDNSNETSTESAKQAHSVTAPAFSDLLEVDYSFSDDSLDFNEESIVDKNCGALGVEDCKCENYCPPDVVAHTKKEALSSYSESSFNITEVPSVEDFEDRQIEFPTMKPGNSNRPAPPSMDEYKSLILGKTPATPSENTFQNESDSGIITIDTSNSVGRKTVSFSHASVIGGNRQSNDSGGTAVDTKNCSLPKSIIKNGNTASRDRLDIIESSNDETDDTSQDQTSLSSVSLSPLKSPRDNLFGMEDNILDSKSNDSWKNLRESERKKVRFVKNEFLGQLCGDSNSYDINLSDDEGEEEEEEEGNDDEERGSNRARKTKDDIVEEYFSEAVRFMRNMNSINEYMNAKNVLHKQSGCGRKRKFRRRKCPWRDHDYVEHKGQRISLKDDDSEYFKDDIDDDILIPTKSYERCLEGIARLEACINEVSRHNDHLRDRYGIDVKSAGAKFALASSSTDCKVRLPKKGLSIVPGNQIITSDVGISANASKDSGLISHQRQATSITTKDLKHNSSLSTDDLDNKNNNVHLKHTDDLERKIFDQLMNVASSAQYRHSKKYRSSISQRVPDLRPDNSLSYSKLRGNYNCTRSQSSHYKSHTFSDSEEDLQDEEHFDNVSYTDSYPREVCHHTAIQKSLSDTKVIRAKIARQISALGSSKEDSKLSGCLSMTLDKKDSSTPYGTVNGERARSTRRSVPPRIEKSSSTDTITTSTESYDGMLHSRGKLRYPGSPRARFLELLNERRRIVEYSRSTSTS